MCRSIGTASGAVGAPCDWCADAADAGGVPEAVGSAAADHGLREIHGVDGTVLPRVPVCAP
jgi:hypothetical protein